MFKNLLIAVALFCSFFSSSQALEVYTLDGKLNASSVEVEEDAARIAVIDFAILDIIDTLDLGHKVVAMPKATTVPYLKKYFENKEIINTGTLKDVDYEALMEAQPDIIFIGGRLGASYDKLSKIAPVVFLHVDYSIPYTQSLKHNTKVIASIFNVENKLDSMLETINARITSIRDKAAASSAIVGIVSSSHFRTLGNASRCSIIGTELNFNNLSAAVSVNHGNESSFELINKLDPDYLFVLDRDSAIGVNGASLAKDTLDNELVRKSRAYRNNNIVYLNPQVWYLCEGGLKASMMMLDDIESIFDNK